MMPTRPDVSRKAISFSLSSRMRTGVPSALSSSDGAKGIQYCRISSPIGVPGPARIISSNSSAMANGSSRCRPKGRSLVQTGRFWNVVAAHSWAGCGAKAALAAGDLARFAEHQASLFPNLKTGIVALTPEMLARQTLRVAVAGADEFDNIADAATTI